MRRSWGHVEELDRGRRYRLSWWEDTDSGRRRVSRTLRCTRREAEAYLDEAHARVMASEGRGRGGSVTLAEAVERWYFPELEARASAEHARVQRSVWGRWLAPALGQVPLSRLRPSVVQGYLDTVGRTQGTRSLIVLRGALDAAVLRDELERSPLDGARLRVARETATKRDARVLNLADMAEACGLVRGAPCEASALLQMHGGCRVGESLGVRTADVSARESGGSTVALAWVGQASGRGGEVKGLKNAQSARWVAVGGAPGARLLELAAEASEGGSEWLSGDGLGGPLSQEAARRSWRACVRGTRFEGLPFHNLRNSYSTTRQWEMELPAEKVAKTMGQLSVAVNQRHYNRPDPTQIAALAAASAGKIGPI